MQNRLLGLGRVLIWFGWLAFAAFLFAGPFRREVKYFLVHGNQVYYGAAIALLVVLAVFCLVYVPLRGRGLWRWELPLIAAFGFCFVLLEQPLALAITVLLFLAFFTVGHRLARTFGIALNTPAETLALGFSIGCGVAIPVLFLLGLLHGYYRAVSWLLVLAPIAFWHREALAALQAIRNLWRSISQANPLRHPFCGIAAIFLAAAVFFSAAGALTPAIAFDTLNFHLPAAQYYSAQHRLDPVPQLSYSYYPQGFETLLMVAYQFGGQASAQLVAPLLFAVFLLLLFAIGRECGLDVAALTTGIACVAMTPFALWDGTQTKTDIGVGLFQLAALLCCLKWRNTALPAWLLLGGFFLATSVAFKYTAVYGAIPLLLLFLAALPRMKAHRLRTAGAFLLLLAVLGSYWQVRAFIYTGDPVYPERMERAAQPGGVRHGGTWGTRVKRLARTAWRLSFEGRPHFESPIQNPLGMFLLTFAPVALLAAWQRNANRRACLFYAGVVPAVLDRNHRRLALRSARLRTGDSVSRGESQTSVRRALDSHQRSRAFFLCRGAGRLPRFRFARRHRSRSRTGRVCVFGAPDQPKRLPRLESPRLPGAAGASGRLDGNAAVFEVDACSHSYSPNPGEFGCSGADNARIQSVLNRHSFDFVAIPAGAKEQRAAIFQGWKAEQVYQDDKYLGYRISR